MQAFANLVGNRKLPEVLAGSLGSVQQGVCCLGPRGHDTCGVVTESDHAGAGQGGNVDDEVRVVLTRAGQAVGHHDASLGIGVAILDCRPIVHSDDVRGAPP